MRKFFIMVLLLAIAAMVYLGYAHFTGGAVPTFGLPIGGEKAHVRVQALAFFEHVKFKNRAAITNFVGSSAAPEETALYLDKTLGMDADQVDLVKVAIKDVELDSMGTRARVKVELSGQDLAANKPFDVEKVIFLYRVADRWLVDIKTLSL